MGNGAAMRVGPLGAWFHKDLDLLIEETKKSAEVTHSHLEGQVGALAVALAAAWACLNPEATPKQGMDMIDFVIDQCPESDVRGGLVRARRLPFEYRIETAVSALGNGHKITAPDTVPFSLWCAARHLDNYQDAFWSTVSALGDRDTTCAIVGSIVALTAIAESLPNSWITRREALT
ncbi:MAG: ADP-ribosylglycohydrolase family protein [Planctomycetota bacterium]|nr:ADP-ribosylglycohydrolase family protein [Planctomycetota bacterium]